MDITGHIDTFGARYTLRLSGDFYKFNFTQSTILGSGPPSLIEPFNPVHPGTPFLGLLLPFSEFTNPQDTARLYLQDQIKLP